jgi:hypothetical protein
VTQPAPADILPASLPVDEPGEYLVTWLDRPTTQLQSQRVTATSPADAAFIVGNNLGWTRHCDLVFVSVERVS